MEAELDYAKMVVKNLQLELKTQNALAAVNARVEAEAAEKGRLEHEQIMKKLEASEVRNSTLGTSCLTSCTARRDEATHHHHHHHSFPRRKTERATRGGIYHKLVFVRM